MAGYLHGYNYKPLPEEVRAAIRSYIDRRQNGVQGYYIPSPKRFGALLKELLRQSELTEQQLAELIGRDQKTVSQYITGDLAADKEQQYFILYSIYKSVKLEYGTADRHLLTAARLEGMLFGGREQEPVLDEVLDAGEAVSADGHRELLEYFSGLPMDMQEKVLSHYRAFFEQTEQQLEDHVTVMIATYSRRVQKMQELMRLSDTQREDTVFALEENAVTSYPMDADWEEICFFDTVTDMRALVTGKDSAPGSRKGRRSRGDTNIHRFERLIHSLGIMSEGLEELKMKAGFSGYEWYCWMLLLINAHNETPDSL